ncbi:hypothetical protein CLF_103351 [Clonorchis sinensis]|uniref:Peptidase S1 domain-containing protein n=1 Tax=Clonorchis sinensis TaxID=79923 RepID=G7Y9L3_CLOSI|nr:hypothetical protein CLF_103351 [Clonorchis sinensis]
MSRSNVYLMHVSCNLVISGHHRVLLIHCWSSRQRCPFGRFYFGDLQKYLATMNFTRAFYALKIRTPTSVRFAGLGFHYISHAKWKSDNHSGFHLKPPIYFIDDDYTLSTLVYDSIEIERNVIQFHRTYKCPVRQRVIRMKTIVIITVSEEIKQINLVNLSVIFNYWQDANDIALLKLTTPLDLTRPNISIVNLPTTQNSTLPQVNETGAIVGFGIFKHPDIDPTTAQLATFKVVTQNKCSQLHGAYDPTYNFCIDDELTRRAMPGVRLNTIYDCVCNPFDNAHRPYELDKDEALSSRLLGSQFESVTGGLNNHGYCIAELGSTLKAVSGNYEEYSVSTVQRRCKQTQQCDQTCALDSGQSGNGFRIVRRRRTFPGQNIGDLRFTMTSYRISVRDKTATGRKYSPCLGFRLRLKEENYERIYWVSMFLKDSLTISHHNECSTPTE